MLKAEYDFLNWNIWTQRDYYLKGLDLTLAAKLNQHFQFDSLVEDYKKLGVTPPKITNAAILSKTKQNISNFETEFLYPEIENWWNNSGTRTRIFPNTEISLSEYFAINKKVVLELSPFAGNGHFKETALKATLLTNATGLESWVLQPEQMLTGLDAVLFGWKSQIHNLMQKGTLSPQVLDQKVIEATELAENLRNTLLPRVSVNAPKIAGLAARFALSATGQMPQPERFDDLSKSAKDFIERVPSVARLLLKAMVSFDTAITEAKLADIIKDILLYVKEQSYKVALIDSSHPFIVRSFVGKYPNASRRVQALIPDRGFYRKIPSAVAQVQTDAESEKNIVMDNYMMQTFSYIPGDTKAALLVPSSKIESSLKYIYENKGPIAVTGELLDSLTPQELAKKWRLERNNIALMVNGNASNSALIRQAVLEYLAEKGWLKYDLAICLFERQLKDIFIDVSGKPVQSEIELVKDALEKHPQHIKVINTGNKIETAFISRYIPRWAHMCIGKPPGENAFMSAAVGCIEVCSYSNMANEQNNMIYNVDKAMISRFPQVKMKRKGEEFADTQTEEHKWHNVLKDLSIEDRQQAEIGFSFNAENFLVYINHIFANNFAKDFAINGYLRSEHLNSLHNLLVSLAQIIEGEVNDENLLEILTFMTGAQTRFNEVLLEQVAQEFNLRAPEVLSRIKGVNLASLKKNSDYFLPNKYLDGINRLIAQQKRQNLLRTNNDNFGRLTVLAGSLLLVYLLYKKTKN